MAFQSHRTRFKGDLVGVEQEKIIELDYTKENLEERKEYIEKKYEEVGKYHREYNDEFYKVNVNTGDNLSSDINIFKAVEKDGNYILNSLDVPRDKEYKYKLLTQEEFDSKIKNENKFELNSEAVMDVLKPDFKNDYVNMDLKILNSDLTENSEMGNVLRDYNKVKNHLKDEMIKIKTKQGSYLNVVKAKMILGTINCDMLDVKKSYKGITRPASKLGDIGANPDLDGIDYKNPAHIKGILTTLRFGEIQPECNLSHMAYDIEFVIKKLFDLGKIDKFDLEVVDCINSGMSIRATALELNRDKKAIQQRLNKICRRIANHSKD